MKTVIPDGFLCRRVQQEKEVDKLNIRVSKRDTIWSYVGVILSMGANLIMLPIILIKLSEDAIALYYIYTSISAIVLLMDFGFSPSIARSMAYAWSGANELKSTGIGRVSISEPNYDLISRIITTCKIIYCSLSLIALMLCSSIGSVYILHILKKTNSPEYIISWIIYIIAIFLNILFSYYSVFLRGVGAVAEINKATIFARVVQIGMCYILVLLGMGLIGVSIAYLLYGCSFRILANIWFYKYKNIGERLKQLPPKERKKSFGEALNLLKIIWPNTWRDGLVTVSNYLLNQATTIICSLYLPLYDTGVYSLTVQLTSAIAQIACTIYTTYQPALQSAYANRDDNSQRRYMSLIIITYVGIFALGLFALLTIGIPIIEIIRPSYKLPIFLVFWVGIYQFVLKYRNCYTSFISTTNRLIYTRAFVISAIVCVVLSIYLCGWLGFGVFGLVISQLVSQLIYNAWHWPILVHKELNYSAVDTIKIGLDSIRVLLMRRNIEGEKYDNN